MSAVRFSVVVPTRERAETLRFALRTCLDQAFDDYEVIVSDNCSSPATKAVVDEAASPKVRYLRTPEPLAMSANWEFAVAHARGEYVTVLGDDDGLLPHALAQLDGLLRAHPTPVLRWELALYTWPTFRLTGHENYLRLPLQNTLNEQSGADVIRAVAAAPERYEDLPMVYNAAVRRDVLEQLRARTGRVFPHPIPDVYSGFAVAHAAGRFLSTSLPLAVRGLSGSSNGIAALFEPGRTAIEREFHALNARAGLRSEPGVPNLQALPAYVADTFWAARRALFPDSDVQLDRRKMVRSCLDSIRVAERDWSAALGAVRDSLGDDPELRAWFDAELAGAPHAVADVTYFKPRRLGFDGKTLHLDASAFGVTDVAGAAWLCGQILSCRPGEYTRPDDVNVVARRVMDLMAPFGTAGVELLRWTLGWWELEDQMSALREQNAALGRACDERAVIVQRLVAQTRELTEHLGAERRWSLKRPARLVKRLLGALTRRGAGRPTASA